MSKLRLAKENIFWGGKLRESVLIKFLLKYYKSKLYRDWGLSKEQPHFFNQRAGHFIAVYDKNPAGFYGYSRGFYAAEVIREGDIILDIGCGDGFFTKHFFSPKCAHIDAIDIEPTAIEAGKYYNSSEKINYVLCDAVKDPFPHKSYDVIVWDGAIGHFDPATINIMLEKIKSALAPDGIFVGSESLGVEGHDHLQYFQSIESLAGIFKPYFSHVSAKSIKYQIPGFMREEGYWKCANSPDRIEGSTWKSF